MSTEQGGVPKRRKVDAEAGSFTDTLARLDDAQIRMLQRLTQATRPLHGIDRRFRPSIHRATV